MKAITGKRLCRLLESHGWHLKRISGSHHIYAKDGEVARISVPVHGNVTLKRGLQAHLMRIAQISENEL
ncbi:MAG: type II toxin-antitoxin system HicA family toxin [Gemmatimonadetes bacterium]|nr:type II toxin-antitoxin system HicA family toxin [Gemmatimonadota bacterium]MXY48124.1 type II toxin-antitoxin system HicA family toxin [Gemmatimonadota bacterium]MYG84131.1 type II toxin-antitoxin system HicA family toxin [Gemmatimonadota bacterium]MYJ89412.1 type II toxin-antitoxin system HicA family toxin [Gemmatimonadota bacterium]